MISQFSCCYSQNRVTIATYMYTHNAHTHAHVHTHAHAHAHHTHTYTPHTHTHTHSQQPRFAEEDSDDNVMYDDPEDGRGPANGPGALIKAGTIYKLVERLTYHEHTSEWMEGLSDHRRLQRVSYSLGKIPLMWIP